MATETLTEVNREPSYDEVMQKLPPWSTQAAWYFLGLMGAECNMEATDANAEKIGKLIAKNVARDTYPTPVDVPHALVGALLRGEIVAPET